MRAQHRNPGRPDWLGAAGRVYLDSTVFESREGLVVSLEQVLPAIDSQQGRVKLVICADSATDLGRGSAEAQSLLKALHAAKQNVEWLQARADGMVAKQSAALIDDDCARQKFETSLLVITQSDKDAENLDNPAQAANSKKAYAVRSACVQGYDIVSWQARRAVRRRFDLGLKDFQEIVGKCRIVVDTCSFFFSWYDEKTPDVFPDTGLHFIRQVLAPALRDRGQIPRMVVPQVVIKEIENGAPRGERELLGKAKAAYRQRSAVVRQVVSELRRAGELEVIEDPVPGQHGDPNLEHMLTHEGSRADLCFITQDRNLARSLLLKRPGPPRRCWVTRVHSTGDALQEWEAVLDYEARRDAATGPSQEGGIGPVSGKGDQPGDQQKPGGEPAAEPVSSPRPADPLKNPPEDGKDSRPVRQAGPPAMAIGKSAKPQKETQPARANSRAPRYAAMALVAVLVVLIGTFLGWGRRADSSVDTSWPSSTAAANGLGIQVMVDGRTAASQGGEVFLRNGTRFSLQIQSPLEGRLDVQAAGDRPDSAAETVFSGVIRPGSPVVTTTMRVTGGPGVDRLHVIHVPDKGGLVTQYEVLIRHD